MRLPPAGFLPAICALALTMALPWPAGAGQPAGPPTAVAAQPDLPAPSRDAAQAELGQPGEEIPAWKARWELARLLSYTKQLDRSAAEYEKLLATRPDLWEARAELAKVLFWAGKRSEALATLEKLPPDKAGDASRLLMADLLAADKSYDRAAALYRAHLKDKPGDLAARFRLAQVLSWAGDYPGSLEQYRLILKERPADIQVRRHYAFVLSWAGRFDEAARELEQTLKD